MVGVKLRMDFYFRRQGMLKDVEVLITYPPIIEQALNQPFLRQALEEVQINIHKALPKIDLSPPGVSL